MSQQYPFQCNIAQALNIIGDKWSLLILHGIMSGHQTYKEIYNSLEGQIASNLLSSRLKALEADGLISSDLYQKHPPRYRYTLTPAGEDLNIVFNSLVLWGEKHLTTCYKRLIHKSCNHTVETHYYCPHCQQTVAEDQLAVVAAEEKELEQGKVKKNVAQIIIAKNRAGECGEFDLLFQGEKSKFINPPASYINDIAAPPEKGRGGLKRISDSEVPPEPQEEVPFEGGDEIGDIF